MRARIGLAALLACALVAGGASAAKKKPKKKPVAAAEPTGVTTIELGTPVPPEAPPPALESTSPDKVIAPTDRVPRRFSVELNPLPIIAGRYGANFEYVPLRHHAVTASAFYQTFTSQTLRVVMPTGIDTSQGADGRPGGELGYRFYTGTRGANGFFAGASAVAMPFALPRLRTDLHTDVVSFETFGGAIDVGAQAITDWGFTIGGGLGVMYIAYEPPASAPLPPGAPNVHIFEPHVLPRLLLAAGWSF